jgi:DNA repair exonuclease SbcCD ATPase subunit
MSKLYKQTELISKINGNCPVCQSELSEIRKKEVKDHLTSDYEIVKTRKELAESQIKDLELKLRSMFDEIKLLKLDEKSTQLRSAEESIIRAKARTDTVTQTVNSNSKELLDRLTKEQGQLKKLGIQQDIYSELAAAFGSKGIPLLIIDSILKELKILINNNLELLSDSSSRVDISTQREALSGKTIDTFQILIQDGLRTIPYHNYSGGERAIIDLSIRLGLSELLARRNNFKIETLFVDEGLDSLDEVNQNNFIKTFFRLTKKFKKIILISHSQVKDYFSQYIEVTKKDNISRIEFYPKVCYNVNRRSQL